MSIAFLETAPHAKFAQQDTGGERRGVVLELSQSRVYDYALNILNAYKLSGNFTCDLKIVLKESWRDRRCDVRDQAEVVFVRLPSRRIFSQGPGARGPIRSNCAHDRELRRL